MSAAVVALLTVLVSIAPEAPSRPASSRDEIIRIISQGADAFGIPREALLALAVAESNLDPSARRPNTADKDEAYWGDISSGLFQQTVRWAPEYIEWARLTGHDPSVFPGADIIERFLAPYYDPNHAILKAAPKLKYYLTLTGGDVLASLSRYNKPNMDPADNKNLNNYRRGLATARDLLGE